MYVLILTGYFGEMVKLPFRWRTWQSAAAWGARYLAEGGFVGYRVRKA